MDVRRRCLAALLSLALAYATSGCANQPDGAAVFGAESGIPARPTYQPAQLTAEQLQQLVAPIALYPDALVAGVLAGSTYLNEIVAADRWLQQHPDLQGSALAQAADRQPWDPSVKALTQFPSVLASMDKNLYWTSALGDAYVNQPQDVLNAVQTLRHRATQAGNLQSSAEEAVTVEGETIVIQPANPDVVYVPAYDPWLVYGAPLPAYPGWNAVPGVFLTGPGKYFGAGFGVGFFTGFSWGWPAWGCDWHGRRVVFHNTTFVSRSRTFDRHPFDHGAFGRGGLEPRGVEHGAFGRSGLEPRGVEHGAFEHDGLEPGGVEHGAFERDGLEPGGVERGGFAHEGSHGGGIGGGGFHGGGGGGHR
jgi:uncharacterized membrane protein YgcG